MPEYSDYMYLYYGAVGFSGLYILVFALFLLCHLHFRDHNEEDEEQMKESYGEDDLGGTSTLVKYLGALLSFLTMFYREVCFLPLAHTLLQVFYCHGYLDDGAQFSTVGTCKGTAHIVFMVLSGLVLFLVLLLVVISSVFYHDTQPDSQLPWANCNLNIILLKQVKKICIAACATLTNWNSNVEIALIILLALLYIFTLAEFARSLYMNNVWVQGFLQCFESGLTWLCCLGFVCRIFDLPCAHDLYTVFAVPVSYLLFRQFLGLRYSRLVYASRVEQMNSQSAVEQYVLVMARLFYSQNKCRDYIALQGVFANHIRCCTAQNCPCADLGRSIEPMEESLSASTSIVKSVNAFSMKQTIQRSLSIHSAEIQLTELNSIGKKRFFEFLKSLIEKTIATIVKPTKLYIQLAYVHFIFLENKFIALYDLMNAQDTKPSLIEEFLIYRLKYGFCQH